MSGGYKLAYSLTVSRNKEGRVFPIVGQARSRLRVHLEVWLYYIIQWHEKNAFRPGTRAFGRIRLKLMVGLKPGRNGKRCRGF